MALSVNTTDYQSKDVAFKNILATETRQLTISRTHSDHLPAMSDTKFEIIEDPDKEIKNGINNVDIDHQMVELARNQMEFEFSGTILARLFKSIQGVINERID